MVTMVRNSMIAFSIIQMEYCHNYDRNRRCEGKGKNQNYDVLLYMIYAFLHVV